MKPTSLLFAALAAVFVLTPTSEAVCANQAVYDECKSRGNAQLSACAFDNWICKCDANNAIQNCYLQCTDDPAVQTEGKALQPSVQQSCTLAADQAAKAKATAPVPVPAPTTAPASAPAPAAPAPAPSASQTSSKAPSTTDTSTTAKSAANKLNSMIAAVPPVVISVIIGQFI